ncbi:MAG: beta-ketoacyl-ACP synthase II [Opitutaceae bacterium]
MIQAATSPKRRVAITGIGAVSPLGLTAAETWAGMIAGRSGIGRITHFDADPCPVKIAGEVKGFDPTQAKYTLRPHGAEGAVVTSPLIQKETRKFGRFTQLGVAAGLEAYADSGLDSLRDSLPSERMGTNLGVGLGGLPEIENAKETLTTRGYRKISPFLIIQIAPNILSGQLAIALNLRGPNYSIASACATSGHSIGEAFRTIQRGEADVMFAGGAESTVTPLAIGSFAQMRALSTRNDEPERASRPFESDRDGFVLGEGAVVFVLEEWEHARARGVRIYAEVRGYGATADAYHISGLAPEAEGSRRAMELAVADAGVAPELIDVISAHATSTPAGDKEEAAAIARLLGEQREKANITAVKSMTGHLLGGAGALGAFASVLAIHDGVVPPTINLERTDPACAATGLNFTPNTAARRSVKVALANAYGFGGTNTSLVFSAP